MKPGDLCIVMGARNTPGLNGRIVELFHERPISVRRLYPITPPTKENEEYKELSNEH